MVDLEGVRRINQLEVSFEEEPDTLEKSKKELATEELVITGQLANNVGQKEATAIVNEQRRRSFPRISRMLP